MRRHTSNTSTKETGVRTGMENRDWAWESSNIAARYKILYISTCSIFVTKSTDFSKEFTQFLKCPNKRFWLKKMKKWDCTQKGRKLGSLRTRHPMYLSGPVEILLLVSQFVQAEKPVRIARNAMTYPVTFPQQASLPHDLTTPHSCIQISGILEYLQEISE